MSLRRTPSSERGAVLVLTALLMTALVLIVALVIDLGSTRSDRREGQSAVDNAATAGAMTILRGGTGQAACEEAFTFLQVALGGVTLTGDSCAAFATCESTDPPIVRSGTDYRATIYRPVPNGAASDGANLMQRTSTIGATGTLAAEGTVCGRFGVRVQTTKGAYFGGIAGQNSRPSAVHAVALVGTPGISDRLINLAVLDRRECGAIALSGQGGVIAEAVVTGSVTEPGTISVDSDGTVSCGTTVSLGSPNNTLRADGPVCSTAIVAGTGQGCGKIDLYASGAPGCNAPACSRHASSTLSPTPRRATARVTREPVDHRYDCKASYATSFWWSQQPDIAACPESGTRPAYISSLISAMPATGAPAGWSTYPRPSTTDTCTHNSSTPIIVPVGNWFVNCGTLSVGGPLTFLGGNILFAGGLDVGSQGVMLVNSLNANSFPWSEDAAFNAAQHSSDASYLYFKDGQSFSKGAQGQVTLNNVMVYMGRTSSLGLGGGSGSLTWTAPRTGPFTDLALWSDSVNDANFGGQASLVMDGAFFTPLSLINYSGQGDNDVTAQFISRKISASGQGAIKLTPTRGIFVPPTATAISLIR